MPVIEVATGIPCPQTSTVTPEERRLLSEGSYGPRGARTIELDERQFQTLTWALSAAQAAIFRDWYRTTLIYGGAWFAAPATWPTPEGLVVKVRRFIGDPQWTYRGNGHWLLAINAEVRGETLLPNEPVTPSGGPWLFFDGDLPQAPIFIEFGSAIDITGLTPVPFTDGVGVVNSDGSGSNTVNVQDVLIPLYSENEFPTEVQYTWAPVAEAPEDPEAPPYPVPGFGDFPSNPYPTDWANATHVLRLNPGGFSVTLSGWPGGVFTLFTNNDATGASGATVITFLATGFGYPPVSIEYVAA